MFLNLKKNLISVKIWWFESVRSGNRTARLRELATAVDVNVAFTTISVFTTSRTSRNWRQQYLPLLVRVTRWCRWESSVAVINFDWYSTAVGGGFSFLPKRQQWVFVLVVESTKVKKEKLFGRPNTPVFMRINLPLHFFDWWLFVHSLNEHDVFDQQVDWYRACCFHLIYL